MGFEVMFLSLDRELTGQNPTSTPKIIPETKDNLCAMSRFSGGRARNRRDHIYPPHYPTSEFRINPRASQKA
jgi:hypothetical protein